MTKRILSLLLCSAIVLTTFFALPQPAVAAEADSSVSEAAIPEESTPPAEETVSTTEPEPDAEAPAPEADASLLPEETPAGPEDSSVPEAPPEPDEAPEDISAPAEEPVPSPEVLPTEEAPEPKAETEPEAEVAAGADETPPQVHGVSIANPTIKKPGVLLVDVDVTEDETGLSKVFVWLVRIAEDGTLDWSQSISEFKTLDTPVYGRTTIQVTVPVSTTARNGQWVIYRVEVEDQTGNRRFWDSQLASFILENPENQHLNLDPSSFYFFFEAKELEIKGQPTKAPVFTVENEFDIAFQLALTHPELVSRINAMEEGKTGQILIDAASGGVLPAAAFDAIRGKDKTLILYADAYQWVINGRDVVNPSIDLAASIKIGSLNGIAYGAADEDVVTVTFAPNGLLPGKARIRIKSDYLYERQKVKGRLYLYYEGSEEYDGEGNLINVEPGELAEIDGNFDLVFDGTDKWCYFDVTHNSKYLVSAAPLAKLKFSAPTQALAINKTLKAPKLTVSPAGSLDAKAVKWTSSNKKIATVNAKTGKVTAKGKTGKVSITATVGGQKASYILNVYSPQSEYTVKVRSASTKKGKVSGGQTAMGGKSITVKATPKKGYTFAGWYDGQTLLSTKAKYKYKVCKNVKLVARFNKK